MLFITNARTEPVKIVYADKNMIIQGGSSCSISDIKKGYITIEHFNFLDDYDNGIDKMICTIAKSSVLIIDVTFFIEEITDNPKIIIKDGIYDYVTGDFGYLYFDVFAENCSITPKTCSLVNRKEILHMQKVMRMGDGYDFPPFSFLYAFVKYGKIRKMCDNEKVLEFLKRKYVK